MPSLSRRQWLELTTAAAATATGSRLGASAETKNDSKWYRNAYRRAVIDMHISDWDEKFLSRFDPKQYAEMLVKSRAQSIVCYGQSHVGLFNYPTKIGKQHAGLKGRNVLGEMIEQCHRHDIAVIVYTSLIFDRWAADNHPEWRMHESDGNVSGAGGRHGLVCPNSPYRDYVRAWVEELCTSFDFEGVRFDMTFWPTVCYCEHCQARFDKEVGGELPRTVNWHDERWVAFQRRREAWLVEFAAVATGTVRKHQPEASVEHQSSTYPLNWQFGVTEALVEQNDFLQGDFYGDNWQGSFVRKLLEDLTPNRPFGYETSFSHELKDHTAMKSEALLTCKAASAIADNAAFIFIDAVDPIGTLDARVHERMGRIFDGFMPYYEHLGGRRVRDIALYYSFESKCNFTTNGRAVPQRDTSDPYTNGAMLAARWIINEHLPLGIITKKSLPNLADHKVLLLTNVGMMDSEEVDAIRTWVRGGGGLYASGWTSLVDKQGRVQKDFMLADVFGVNLRNPRWNGWNHYIAPTAEGRTLLDEFNAEYPAYTQGLGMEITARPEAEVLATTTLPWPTPDPSRFASIHSNPPWQPTDHPEIVFNRFGKGRVAYCASPIEEIETLRGTFIKLLRRLYDRYTYQADAPAVVEMTLYNQPDRQRYLLSLVNFQRDLPNIPVNGITIRLRLPNRTVHRIVQLPDRRKIEHHTRNGAVVFTAPRLETLAMFAVETT